MRGMYKNRSISAIRARITSHTAPVVFNFKREYRVAAKWVVTIITASYRRKAPHSASSMRATCLLIDSLSCSDTAFPRWRDCEIIHKKKSLSTKDTKSTNKKFH